MPAEDDEDENTSQGCAIKCRAKRYYLAVMMSISLSLMHVTSSNMDIVIALTTKVHALNVTVKLPFTWDDGTQFFLISSYYYVVMLTQIPGAYFAEAIGGSRVIVIAMIGTALASLITPFSAKISFIALVFVRVFCGFFQGLLIPAMIVMWVCWAPRFERTTLINLNISGFFMFSPMSYSMTTIIATNVGWEWTFYILTISIFTWSFCWYTTVWSSPSKDKCLTKSEYLYLSMSTEQCLPTYHPWKAILTSQGVWAIVFANFAYYNGFYFKDMYFTTQFYTMRNVDFFFKMTVGYIGLFMTVLLSSMLADYLLRKGKLSTLAARKLFCVLGFVLQAVFMLMATLDKEGLLTVLGVTFSVILGGFSFIGFVPNSLDIAPRHAGVITGLARTIGTTPGIIAPYVCTKFIPPNAKPEDWKWIWLSCTFVYSAGAILYLALGKGDLEPWTFTVQNQN